MVEIHASSGLPQYHSADVKSITRWEISSGRNIAKQPEPLWACQDQRCQHTWPRESST